MVRRKLWVQHANKSHLLDMPGNNTAALGDITMYMYSPFSISVLARGSPCNLLMAARYRQFLCHSILQFTAEVSPREGAAAVVVVAVVVARKHIYLTSHLPGR